MSSPSAVTNISRFFFKSFFLVLITIYSFNAIAWNAVGHMVIASIAYQNLKPVAKRNVDMIASNFVKEYPNMKTFLDLSYWPDAIRSQRINTYTHWHFIDVPFTKDNSKLVNTIKDENVVWAINNVHTVVKNAKANSFERMRFLSFLIHFVGDIHQPLHTSTLISKAHPTGDKGGNLYDVYVDSHRVKLHELWDCGVGIFATTPTLQNVNAIAKQIMAIHPQSEFGDRALDLDPDNWAKEGMKIAQEDVYSVGENSRVTTQYLENGKRRMEERAALAGYRLAVMLNAILS